MMDNNSYILDFQLLAEHGISLEEYIYLIKRNDPDFVIKRDITESLESKQFIKVIDIGREGIILREKGRLFLELILIKVPISKTIKKTSKEEPDDLTTFIKEFRQLWKGKKPGSMGSDFSCREKMHRWMKNNPSYTKEEILKAAKLYLNSLEDNRYLQRADYFIFKKELGGEEQSRLSAFIEEVDDKPIITDWTSNII